MASTRLKMAAFAPMPSARVKIAVTAKPGFLTNWRVANRISRKRFSNHAWLFLISMLPCAPGGLPNTIPESRCTSSGLSSRSSLQQEHTLPG